MTDDDFVELCSEHSDRFFEMSPIVAATIEDENRITRWRSCQRKPSYRRRARL